MNKERLVNLKFNEIVNESGANVMELKLNDNKSIRTWGHSEEGNVSGMYFYNKDLNQYSETTSFL